MLRVSPPLTNLLAIITITIATSVALSPWHVQAAQNEPALATLHVESAFTQTNEVPLNWIELLVFNRDPATLEFFEPPVEIGVGKSQLLLKLRPVDFSFKKIWILYRLDESAAEKVNRGDLNQVRLHESYKNTVWAFVVPFSADLDRITIRGTRLSYRVKGTDAVRLAAGNPYGPPLPRYGARKGASSYVRIDDRPEFKFSDLAARLNAALPEPLRLDPANERVWQANLSLHISPKVIGGRPYHGPRDSDRLLIEQGYTPVFIVVKDSVENVALRSGKPWVAAHGAGAENIYADLGSKDPALWARLPPAVKARYQAPSAVRAGTQARIVVFWKSSQDAGPPPEYFLLYIRRPAGEDLRTAVLFRLPAAGR